MNRALLLTLLVFLSVAAEGAYDLAGNDSPSIHIEYLVDESNNLTLADLPHAGWQQNHQAPFNIGVQPDTVWLRFNTENSSPSESLHVLSLGKALFDVLEIYELSDSDPRLIFNYADDASRIDALRRYGTIAVPMDLNRSAELIIKFKASNSLIRLDIQTQSDFSRQIQSRHYFVGAILFGVSIFILFATLPLAFVDRTTFVLYGSSQVVLFTLCLHLDGYTTAYFWPENPGAWANFGSQMAGLYNLILIQFARAFFDTKARSAGLDMALKVLMGLGIAYFVLTFVAILAPVIDRRFAALLALPFGFVTWLVLPAIAIFATVRWNASYWPLSIAWLGMSSFSTSIILVYSGTFNQMPFGNYWYPLVLFTEAFCLVLALLLRVRQDQVALSVNQVALELADAKVRTALQELIEKGKIIRAAGHDARQLIQAIRLKAQSGQSKQLDYLTEDLDELLGIAVQSTETDGLAENVVALEEINCDELFHSMRLIYGDEARNKGLQLRWVEMGLHIVTDRALLLRILSNLISNAIKYTGEGGVLVATRRRAGRDVIQVFDTGVGLSEAELMALKDSPGQRFARDMAAGSGTGYQNIYAFAERLGIGIKLSSRPGRGTRVDLILPMQHAGAGTAIKSLDPDITLPEIDSLEQAITIVPAESLAEFTGDPKKCVVTTYDRSPEQRLMLAKRVNTILYQPVSQRVLKFLVGNNN